jgi:hypothetical protein
MFFSKKTKVDLTSAMMSAIQHIQQALEVLTGELVQIHHMPLEIGPILKRTGGDGLMVWERSVTLQGECTVFPSCRLHRFAGNFLLVKDSYNLWRVQGTADLALSGDGSTIEDYIVRWSYSTANYPLVGIIHKRSRDGERPMWRVGRSREDRCEVDMFA